MACPICKKPTIEQYRPFCCKRCADVDLGRWFSGSYVIEGAEGQESEQEQVPEKDLEE